MRARLGSAAMGSVDYEPIEFGGRTLGLRPERKEK